MKRIIKLKYLLIILLIICLILLLVNIPLFYSPYYIKESRTGEKYDLYCNIIKIGMNHKEVNSILSQFGEYREQRIRQSENYIEVKILYEDSEINNKYGRIIIAYENEIVYSILASGGYDVLLPYCNK